MSTAERTRSLVRSVMVSPSFRFTMMRRSRIGSTGTSGHVFGVDRLPVAQRIVFKGKAGATGDIALLHLSRPVPASLQPLPLRFSVKAVPSGSDVTFFGWGETGLSAGKRLYATRAGEWMLKDTCHLVDQACYARALGAFSFPAAGDSGSPVAARVHGSWVDVGVFTGSGGPLVTIAKSGDVEPGGGRLGEPSDPAISDGTVAFSTGAGIYTGSGGPLTPIAKFGDTLPDGQLVTILSPPAISGKTVAFTANFWNPQQGSDAQGTMYVGDEKVEPVQSDRIRDSR